MSRIYSDEISGKGGGVEEENFFNGQLQNYQRCLLDADPARSDGDAARPPHLWSSRDHS